MTERQQKLLNLLVKEYIDTAKPVSSDVLEKKCKLGISTATIRNELGELEKAGYITHPHTSAGRIPTATGYRFFVNGLERYLEVARGMQDQMIKRLQSARDQHDHMLREATKLLAGASEDAALTVGDQVEKPAVDESKVTVHIGSETPLTKELDCSMILKSFRLPSGERGLIGIVGPTRMKYPKNMSLVNYISRILSGGALAFMMFVIFI